MFGGPAYFLLTLVIPDAGFGKAKQSVFCRPRLQQSCSSFQHPRIRLLMKLFTQKGIYLS